MKTAVVLGAGGFIGSHMVKRLKSEGYWVRGVDLKFPEFSKSPADEFVIADLRDPEKTRRAVAFMGQLGNYHGSVSEKFWKPFDEVYQFAADMGGAGYIFSGEHDADVMHNSATINLNVLDALAKMQAIKTTIFYSSSACIYPEYNQLDPNNPNCSEDSAYPAAPDSEYGWEKLFSERLYFSYARNYGLNVRVARFHNIFGPEGTWQGGREKAPAALCRKVIEAEPSDIVEIWGDGKQTRSFLYIDECIEAIRRLVQSDFTGPVNIGSEEMVTINQLLAKAQRVEGKHVLVRHIDGPLGVRGRNSDNTLIREKLDWDYTRSLQSGINETYRWIKEQVENVR